MNIKLTLVVSPADEMVEQTVHDGDDEGCGENAAVEKTAESLTKVCKVLLRVLVTLGLEKHNRSQNIHGVKMTHLELQQPVVVRLAQGLGEDLLLQDV